VRVNYLQAVHVAGIDPPKPVSPLAQSSTYSRYSASRQLTLLC
jgi:hypothetical protein